MLLTAHAPLLRGRTLAERFSLPTPFRHPAAYFKNIRDTNQRFTQIFSNNGQWTSRTQNGITMLNTDVSGA